MKKRKKKRNSLIKWFFALLTVAFICGIGLFVYARFLYSPTRLIERYIDSFMAKNETALFDSLNLKRTNFLSAEGLGDTLDEVADWKELTAYSLVSTGDTPDEMRYQITYSNDRRQTPYSQSIILRKSTEKAYYLFDRWVIDSSDLIAKNCSIGVPLGATLTIDHIPVGADSIVGQEKAVTVYELGDLFVGTHEITLTLSGFKTYKRSIHLTPADYYGDQICTLTPSLLSLDDASRNLLGTNVKNMLISLYDNMLKQNPFDTFASSISFENEKFKLSMARAYDIMLSSNIKASTHLSNVEFKKCKSSSEPTFAEDDCYAVKVTTSVAYVSICTVINDDVASRRKKKYHQTFTTIYHYMNGVWNLYDSTVFNDSIKFPTK